jgi:hypothetical protein
VAVISRSFASARIAVPSFVKRRNALITAVSTNASTMAMICVRVTFVPQIVYR